jgi:hypothetical protein
MPEPNDYVLIAETGIIGAKFGEKPNDEKAAELDFQEKINGIL